MAGVGLQRATYRRIDGRGHIVAASRLQLVNINIIISSSSSSSRFVERITRRL